jgi:hypothetical protein
MTTQNDAKPLPIFMYKGYTELLPSEWTEPTIQFNSDDIKDYKY